MIVFLRLVIFIKLITVISLYSSQMYMLGQSKACPPFFSFNHFLLPVVGWASLIKSSFSNLKFYRLHEK